MLKSSEIGEKKLGDSSSTSVNDMYRSTYKESNSSVTTSGRVLNELIAKYPNGDFADFKIYLYNSHFIGKDEVGSLKFDVRELKSKAQQNPYGFTVEYTLLDKKTGMGAIIEFKVKTDSRQLSGAEIKSTARGTVKEDVPPTRESAVESDNGVSR